MEKITQGTICTYTPKIVGLPEKIKVRICGISSTEQPLIGSMYIVEVLDGTLPSEYYPYTHTVAPQCNLTVQKFEGVTKE